MNAIAIAPDKTVIAGTAHGIIGSASSLRRSPTNIWDMAGAPFPKITD